MARWKHLPHPLIQRLTATTLIAALLVPVSALAGSAEDEGRQFFEEGASAERAGKPAEARAKFRQSVREIGPTGNIGSFSLKRASPL